MARLLDHPTWESFLRFLLFPKFVLRAPRHGARKDNRGMPTGSLQALIRDRIIMSVDNSIPELWGGPHIKPPTRPPTFHTPVYGQEAAPPFLAS
jgi:hypothetical protein